MKRVGLITALILGLFCIVGIVALQLYRARRLSELESSSPLVKVMRRDLELVVVETGKIEAFKTVEIKSRVAGRLARLFVEEGDLVKAGQLIARIDPQETQLLVDQTRAQVRGATSGVRQADIEIAQRRVTAKAQLDQARARAAQLWQELKAQPTLTKSAITSAETAFRSAQQAYEQLIRTGQPNERASVASSLAEAESTLNNAQAEYDRRRGLEARGFVARREVEDARLQLELARTRLDLAKQRSDRLAAQQQLERQQAQERVRQTESELQRARANAVQDPIKRKEYESALASVRVAEAALKDVEVLRQSKARTQASVDQLKSSLAESLRQLGETEIKAPMDGVVTKKLIQEGELVSSLSSFSAGTPIVMVEDRRSMIVKLDINEIDTARLSTGLQALVEVDAIPNETFKGTVSKIAPTSSASTTTTATIQEPVVRYQVEVTISSADPRLKSGMSAKCTVTPSRRDDVLVVPPDFLGQDDQGEYVLVLPPGDDIRIPKKRHVKIGLRTIGLVEIVSGVKEGEELQKPTYSGPPIKGTDWAQEHHER